ncbi:hypothetical protein V6L77_03260 [Pannonibacter sp. Pt2-lr]
MDRKPERALAVLNRTRQANLPSSLERQRNIIEARAMTESGRPDLALELVRNMRGADVDRLRADTFWKAQSWREAGEQLEAMYGSRWSDNIPLEQIERDDILKAAIGYSLAGDQLSLDRLRTKYAKKMADSPQSASFEVVTRPIAAQGSSSSMWSRASPPRIHSTRSCRNTGVSTCRRLRTVAAARWPMPCRPTADTLSCVREWGSGCIGAAGA